MQINDFIKVYFDETTNTIDKFKHFVRQCLKNPIELVGKLDFYYPAYFNISEFRRQYVRTVQMVMCIRKK